MPRGSGSSRRPRAQSGTPRETAGSRPTARPMAQESVVLQEAVVIEPRSQAAQRDSPVDEEPRFQIFIVDGGWNSPARRVLHENFRMLRDLAKNDPIYVLSREKSIEFILSHASLLGKGPAIVVHDLAALREGGTGSFHGFRLHLGLMRSEEQALLALELFTRFLATHRQSTDLEAEIRRDLRREGIIGAIEIILHHEPREIGG
jgi:hypothetical protein